MIKHLANGETILRSEGHQEVFTELHGEEKREEGDRGDKEEGEERESKGEREV